VSGAARLRAGDVPLAFPAPVIPPLGGGAYERLAPAVRTGEHAPASDAADVVVPGERADLHAEGCVAIHGRRGHLVDDHLEECVQPFVGVGGEVAHHPTMECGAVDDGEVGLRVARAQLDEKVEGPIEGRVRRGARAVDLVEHDDGSESQPQRAHEHVAGLGHRAFIRIDDQQHGIRHGQHALDFSGEVRVAGGVDDVDEVAAPLDGAVLGANGDAALALEFVGIHHALFQVLGLPEGAGGAEDGVDQRRFAMIDMGDDGQVSDFLCGNHAKSEPFGTQHKTPANRLHRGRYVIIPRHVKAYAEVMKQQHKPPGSSRRISCQRLWRTARRVRGMKCALESRKLHAGPHRWVSSQCRLTSVPSSHQGG